MVEGIVGYGVEIPTMRIKVSEIARVWEKDGAKISSSLGVEEKAVAAFDEDAATLAVEAARKALDFAKIDPQKIGALFVGSESHPYAVKPTGTIVIDAIGAGPDVMTADLEFACKAGTAGMQICLGFVKAGMIEYGMAIGSDTAQGRPGDALEFTAGSGAAAFIIGANKSEIIATIDDTYSFTTDTPDFWRRQHAEFPRHAGRFTGEPAYFKHVISAARTIMKQNSMNASDFKYVVFHQPNGKFPMRAAKILGFKEEQLLQGLVVSKIGNTYSGSSLIGLASVLDVIKAGEKILCVSYGSGAGSDAFILSGTKIAEKKRAKISVLKMIEEKEYVDYATYVKHRRKLKTM